MKEIIKMFDEAMTAEAFGEASEQYIAYYQTASKEEQEELGNFMLNKANELLAQSKEARRLTDELIAEYYESKKKINIEIDGKKFPLSEWVTMKEYCRRFGLKNTMVISNWITRKIIPEENVLRISQLNDLTLIKAVPYKS